MTKFSPDIGQILFIMNENGDPVAIGPNNPLPMSGGGAGGSSEITTGDITDASSVGKQVLTAANALAARTAIGAGTSNLTIGSSASNAKAGDYRPSSADISDASAVGKQLITAASMASARATLNLGTLAQADTVTASKIEDATATGRSMLTAADAAAARTAIGAGTSNLALGTTASTALAGNTPIPAAPAVGTAAMLEAGTDTTVRVFSAKTIHDEIARQIAAISG
ncbi:hypothetical protein D3C74_152250 [compost metagenome]